MSGAGAAVDFVCPGCGTRTTTSLLESSDYRCTTCRLEVAHVDLAATGAVREVLGWLHTPGEVIAERYRIVRILGKGGSGATYLVEDQRVGGRRRALKEIPQATFDEIEIHMLSRLAHPAIPDVTDRFELDDMHYLVLEFGGDRTMESVRREAGGRIRVDRLRGWIDQLCDVLHYLHTQDPPIVHRDLKPENILLDPAGRVMLIDFGIAKEADLSTATRMVARAVSHGFSPPEQALGTGTDERSDVYALGATVYALLTGVTPPAAHERVAGARLERPRDVEPSIPEGLERTILRALALNMNERQQSIAEFREAVAADVATTSPRTFETASRTVMLDGAAPPAAGGASLAGESPVDIPTPGGRGRARWILAACALLAVSIAAVVFLRLRGEVDAVPTQEPSAGSGVAGLGTAEEPFLPPLALAPNLPQGRHAMEEVEKILEDRAAEAEAKADLANATAPAPARPTPASPPAPPARGQISTAPATPAPSPVSPDTGGSGWTVRGRRAKQVQ